MAKIATDISQSKKLAEILPIESADMHYWKRTWRENDYAISVGNSQEWKEGFEAKGIEYIPCWSLAALLGVLPNNENISTNLSKGGYRISTLEYTNSWFVDYEDETDGLNNCVTSADNPVDACVEMITKLKEKGLL